MSRSSEADDLLLEAEAAFDRGEPAEAARLIRRALELALPEEGSPAHQLLRRLLRGLRGQIPGPELEALQELAAGDEEGLSHSVSAGPKASAIRPPPAMALPPTLEAAPGGSRSLAVDQPLERTPHLELVGDPALVAGAAFQAEVWADTGPADAGAITDAILVHGPADQRLFHFTVWLVASAHFAVAGPREQTLTIDRQEASTPRLRFDLRVVDTPPAGGEAFVTAIFLYQGRPSGSVQRPLALAGAAPSDAAEEKTSPKPTLEANAGRLADLNVLIAGDGQNGWTCRVSSPLLPALENGVTGPWQLGERVSAIVLRDMEQFMNGSTPRLRRAALKGAGKNFFEAAPAVFKEAYWQLVDAGRPPKSLALVSAEPYMPWELMVPERRKQGEVETRDPLGVEMAIGRWTQDEFVAPRQHLALQGGFVLCPTDSGLSLAEGEAQFVLATVPGSARVEPASADHFDELLEDAKPSLLHFVCHGISDETGVGQQLTFEGQEAVTTSVLRGLEGVVGAVRRGHPLVFLNACQVGRLQIDLVRPGGFAEVFMREGASAVVAALWSVEDTIASEIAETFYQALKDGKSPADTLRQLRAKSYQGASHDSYAAYCFYGDPLAVGAIP